MMSLLNCLLTALSIYICNGGNQNRNAEYVYYYHYTTEDGYHAIMDSKILKKSTQNIFNNQKGVYFTQLSPLEHNRAEILKNNYDSASAGRDKFADYVFKIKVPKHESDKYFVDAGSDRNVFVYLDEDFRLEQDNFAWSVLKWPKSREPLNLYSFEPQANGHTAVFEGKKTKITGRNSKGETIGNGYRQSVNIQNTETGYFYNTVNIEQETLEVKNYHDPTRATSKTTTPDGTETHIELTDLSKAGLTSGIRSLSKCTSDMIKNGDYLNVWWEVCIPNAAKDGSVGLVFGAILPYIGKVPVVGPIAPLVLRTSNLIQKHWKNGNVELDKEDLCNIVTMMLEVGVTGAVASIPGIGWATMAVFGGVGFSAVDSVMQQICTF